MPLHGQSAPFVIGRRNWLFSDTVEGGRASANLYSLIETVKAHDLEPYRYQRHVFLRTAQGGRNPVNEKLESTVKKVA